MAAKDLNEAIDWSAVECLNQKPDHMVQNALKQGWVLRSGEAALCGRVPLWLLMPAFAAKLMWGAEHVPAGLLLPQRGRQPVACEGCHHAAGGCALLCVLPFATCIAWHPLHRTAATGRTMGCTSSRTLMSSC